MPTRSPKSWILPALVLLSGWAAAIGLGIRLWELRSPPTGHAENSDEIPVGRIFAKWVANPKLAAASVGFCLLDENGKTIFASALAETALCPASSLKTATTGAAFGLLGPEFRFETKLMATAPLDAAGATAGNLILVGSGDPTLAREDLDQLADDAIAAGLKSVAGRLLADVTAIPDPPMSDHWNWGDIGNGYGAGAFGLNVDHNRVTIRFDPGSKPGEAAKLLGADPEPPETHWENHVVTGAAGSGDAVVVYSTPYGRTITLRGTVPAGESGFSVTGAIPDPPALAIALLRTRLQAGGVKFADQAGLPATDTMSPLSSHQSPRLPEIVDHLHRVSDNLEAQCFFLTIGRTLQTDPAETVRGYWEKQGVTFVGLRLLDGSGLARANMIRPLDLARVNFAARHGPHGDRFYESLSGYLGGHIRGKIGGMSGVKTQVGFLRTAGGRELTLALMANGLPADLDFWGRLEELLEAIRTASF